jgi:hypothetical protein
MWKLWPISHQTTVTHFAIFYHAGYFSSQMKKPPLLSHLSAEQKKNTVTIWYDLFHKILELTMVRAPALNVVSPLWKSVSIPSLISNEKFCSKQYLLKNNTNTVSHIVQIHAHSSYYARLAPYIFLPPSFITPFNFVQQISANKHSLYLQV